MSKFSKYLQQELEKGETTKQELYASLVEATQACLSDIEMITGEKKLYYFSAEFLLGKMLTNNLLNLGVYEEAEACVKELGYTMKELQDMEQEPSLGNGGLGRLAACFLDSIATLGYCGDGVGLYYHFGLFEQRFAQLKQQEFPNTWIDQHSWFRKVDTAITVSFPHVKLQAVRYDMDVIGYHGKKNTLHLFDIETIEESIVQDGITFDKTDIEKNLTLFLYPDDSDEAGRLLRIYQQYFMVSCGAQMLLQEYRETGKPLEELAEHVVIQINDTHPTMVLLELIRLLMTEGISLKNAVRIVEKTCAYTNHTILAEALETWPMSFMEQVVPQLVPIMEALDLAADQRSQKASTAIIDDQQGVHMAHIDIHFGKSINGVAKLHTDILKETELHDFYKLYPEKFNNKTNGITFRRWLYACNPQLTSWLQKLLPATAFQRHDFSGLLAYQHDPNIIKELLKIKQDKKQEWANHIRQKQGIVINPCSIYDTQVKRMHEYKRQQMNALYIIYQYKQIKAGHLPMRPITCIFGAKAAPAYTIAKDIIHILLCLQEIINHDPKVSPYLKLCFIENYNITEAELVIPASDISEQISLASKEASGTGNMKFMLNGALTLGTRDGANVEIAELVKEENVYMFGKDSEAVIQHYAKQDYCSKTFYEQDELIQELVDFLIGDEMMAVGDRVNLERFYQELLGKDWFMTLLDVKEYIEVKEKMLADYEDRLTWGSKMLANIAGSGFFSSDRTIAQYQQDIWKL